MGVAADSVIAGGVADSSVIKEAIKGDNPL
jgi:hypothetical protein